MSNVVSYLSQSFRVDLSKPQFLPAVMPVTATLCHTTELARQVKDVDDQRTPTHLILRYLPREICNIMLSMAVDQPAYMLTCQSIRQQPHYLADESKHIHLLTHRT